MSYLTSICGLFCCVNSGNGKPIKQTAVLQLPNKVFEMAFIYCSGKGLRHVETCRRFRDLTRNESITNAQGEEHFRNNPFWFSVLQRYTKENLPFTQALNYKSLYSLFIVKCYPIQKLPLREWKAYAVQEYTDHSKVTKRCRGLSCVTKERALFTSIVDRDISIRTDVLKTIFLIAGIFPLRTLWDKEGNEMRFCKDCKTAVMPDHGYQLVGQDCVKCYPIKESEYSWDMLRM